MDKADQLAKDIGAKPGHDPDRKREQRHADEAEPGGADTPAGQRPPGGSRRSPRTDCRGREAGGSRIGVNFVRHRHSPKAICPCSGKHATSAAYHQSRCGNRSALPQGVPEFELSNHWIMDLSIVIPVRNEAANIAPLVAEIRAALDGVDADYEIVYVDDGSSDGTAAEIMRLAVDRPRLRLLRHARSCGQSAAIRTGVKAARAPWIATLDGDGQNDPADIPALWRSPGRRRRDPPLLVAGHRAEAARQLVEARCLADRQRGARARLLQRRHARHRLRPEAVPARALSRSAVFRPHAPVSAGAGAARGRNRALGAGQPPAARARRLEIRRVRPALGRHRRSLRRDVAAAPRVSGRELRRRSADGSSRACRSAPPAEPALER